MVAHRLAFLAAGHYAPIAAAVAELAESVPAPGVLLDIGAGPGWYAARLLDHLPARHGLALDSSTAAIRRAARAHPRLAPAERGRRDLPDHAGVGDGRARRRVGRHRAPNLWGGARRGRDAVRGGAAGALHGALQAGALATTFTASQGLLLMIPNMYKIAGELTPFVHARGGAHAGHPRAVDLRRPLRRDGRPQTGFAMLASGSVQEAQDLAAIAHAATLAARCRSCTSSTASAPRTRSPRSQRLDDDVLRALIDDDAVAAHRARALSPDAPWCAARRRTPTRSSRPARPPTRSTTPARAIVQRPWTSFAALTGRRYRLFDYVGAPRRRAGDRDDGLGRRGPRTRRSTTWWPAARRSACSRCASTGRSRPPRCWPPCRRACAASRCSTAPRSPAPRRAAVPGRDDGLAEDAAGGALRRACRGHRRALRPGSSRSSPGDGGRLRRAGRRFAPPRFTVGHRRRRHPPVAAVRPDDLPHRAPTSDGGVLRPRLGRHGRRQQELDQDHRRGDRPLAPRATSSTTRRSPARPPCRTCASGRADPLGLPHRPGRLRRLHQFELLERLDVLERPRRAPRCCSTPPGARRRGTAAARGAAGLIDKKLRCS
jgi:hypothetical protein